MKKPFRRRAPLTPAETARFIRAVENGVPLYGLSARFGYSREYIKNLVAKLGKELKRPAAL